MGDVVDLQHSLFHCPMEMGRLDPSRNLRLSARASHTLINSPYANWDGILEG